MSRFEKFAAEEDVITRIEELRADGYDDAGITVISKQKLEDAYLKYREVYFKHSEGTTWDKFVSMFSDDEPKDKVLAEFDITESEKEHFKAALDREEILLLKESHAAHEEDVVRNVTPEHHETQQQDTQSLESEAEQSERLQAQNVTPEQRSGDSYDHGSTTERDRLHTAEEDDRFDSLDSSKASSKGAGGSMPSGPTYEEQADRTIRSDITMDADRHAVEQDDYITLKDSSSDKDYGYDSTDSDSSGIRNSGSEDNGGYDYQGKKEYSYDRSPEDYDYKE